MCERPVTTLYITIGLPTGDSPYETNLDKDISTGNGYYSLGFGASMSYVIDPVVPYDSLGYTWNLPVDDMHQTLADNSQLEKILPGNTINFNMGMAYALSYDASLATSYQMAYTLENRHHTTADTFESSEQTSSVTNFSLGLRTSPDYVVNVNTGFSLTEDPPDVLLGLSVPLDIKGLKAQQPASEARCEDAHCAALADAGRGVSGLDSAGRRANGQRPDHRQPESHNPRQRRDRR